MRRLSTLLGAGGLAILAAACMVQPVPAPLPSPVIPPPLPAGTCDASKVASAVGQIASADLLEQITLAAGASRARVLHPGDVVTMEFAADRLTISVDAGNRITDLRCG